MKSIEDEIDITYKEIIEIQGIQKAISTAKILLQTWKTDKRINPFKRAREMNQTSYQLALMYETIGETEKAIEVAKKAYNYSTSLTAQMPFILSIIIKDDKEETFALIYEMASFYYTLDGSIAFLFNKEYVTYFWELIEKNQERSPYLKRVLEKKKIYDLTKEDNQQDENLFNHAMEKIEQLREEGISDAEYDELRIAMLMHFKKYEDLIEMCKGKELGHLNPLWIARVVKLMASKNQPLPEIENLNLTNEIPINYADAATSLSLFLLQTSVLKYELSYPIMNLEDEIKEQLQKITTHLAKQGIILYQRFLKGSSYNKYATSPPEFSRLIMIYDSSVFDYTEKVYNVPEKSIDEIKLLLKQAVVYCLDVKSALRLIKLNQLTGDYVDILENADYVFANSVETLSPYSIFVLFNAKLEAILETGKYDFFSQNYQTYIERTKPYEDFSRINITPNHLIFNGEPNRYIVEPLNGFYTASATITKDMFKLVSRFVAIEPFDAECLYHFVRYSHLSIVDAEPLQNLIKQVGGAYKLVEIYDKLEKTDRDNTTDKFRIFLGIYLIQQTQSIDICALKEEMSFKENKDPVDIPKDSPISDSENLEIGLDLIEEGQTGLDKQDPLNEEILTILGEVAYAKNEYEKAYSLFSEIITRLQLSPKSLPPEYNSRIAPEAMNLEFDKLPNFFLPNAYLLRALVSRRLQRSTQEILNDFQESISLNPTSLSTVRTFLFYYMELKKEEKLPDQDLSQKWKKIALHCGKICVKHYYKLNMMDKFFIYTNYLLPLVATEVEESQTLIEQLNQLKDADADRETSLPFYEKLKELKII